MAENFQEKLNIRDGVVKNYDTGYILACDPELEEREIPHANFFKWSAGSFMPGSLYYDAHSICIISIPEPGMVMVEGFGEYGIVTQNTSLDANIFDGQTQHQNHGSFLQVTEIEGRAYASGTQGMVYRLDTIGKWTSINSGLPDSFDITAIDGFDGSDIYAVGYGGKLWHHDGSKWLKLDLPTNLKLNAVKCAGDGYVYIGGNDGILIRGRESTWQILAEDETMENIWDVDWFERELYVSTMSFLYRLKDGVLELVDFDGYPPETCYHLSTAEGVMWSIGGRDIMSFDGREWKRIW